MSNDGPGPKAPITPAFDITQPKERIIYTQEALLKIKEENKDLLALSKDDIDRLKKCGVYAK